MTKTAIFEMFKTWWCLFLFAISCTKLKMIMKVVTFFWINYTRLKKSKNLVYVVNLVWTNPISKIQGFENCLYVYLHGIWRQRKLMATLRSLINVQCSVRLLISWTTSHMIFFFIYVLKETLIINLIISKLSDEKCSFLM